MIDDDGISADDLMLCSSVEDGSKEAHWYEYNNRKVGLRGTRWRASMVDSYDMIID